VVVGRADPALGRCRRTSAPAEQPANDATTAETDEWDASAFETSVAGAIARFIGTPALHPLRYIETHLPFAELSDGVTKPLPADQCPKVFPLLQQQFDSAAQALKLCGGGCFSSFTLPCRSANPLTAADCSSRPRSSAVHALITGHTLAPMPTGRCQRQSSRIARASRRRPMCALCAAAATAWRTFRDRRTSRTRAARTAACGPWRLYAACGRASVCAG
jgi:hypothetical protein